MVNFTKIMPLLKGNSHSGVPFTALAKRARGEVDNAHVSRMSGTGADDLPYGPGGYAGT